MKRFLSKIALAASLVLGTLGGTAAPSLAQEYREATVQLVQDRRGDRDRHWRRDRDRDRHWHRHRDRDRWHRDRRWHRPPPHYRHSKPSVIIERPVIVRPRYVAPRRGLSSAHINWCHNRYRSYRASDNTFQPYNGPRRQCYSPYS